MAHEVMNFRYLVFVSLSDNEQKYARDFNLGIGLLKTDDYYITEILNIPTCAIR